MSLEKMVKKAVQDIKKATIDYQPTITTLQKNKTKTIMGAAVLGGLYLIPGNQYLLSYAALMYTSLKGYQSVRDWAGK
ncbi:MAG: hypothetical protein KJ583_03245 [Nanoarchaeota archaeon]|nr:hypothetical protein [Nanoarchaeota archaeon]MBU1269393.1 hypothetical protein [Nanoarchaeota archaeon]MBU1604310.1 hypothetical protein [Nanoarchaeota archaeon]MBU2442893.1 hypothetical protein [Nanoarchaeota archaeon]